MAPSESPSDDVTFRPSDAPAPRFSGMTPTLPPALRELRHQNNTPRPSELTALARRFGGIRLDQSPNSEPPTPKASPEKMLPVKLEFSEQDDLDSKENVATDMFPVLQNRHIPLSVSNSGLLPPVSSSDQLNSQLSRYDHDGSRLPHESFLIQSGNPQKSPVDSFPALASTSEFNNNGDSNLREHSSNCVSHNNLDGPSVDSEHEQQESAHEETKDNVPSTDLEVSAHGCISADSLSTSINGEGTQISEQTVAAIHDTLSEVDEKNNDNEHLIVVQEQKDESDSPPSSVPCALGVSNESSSQGSEGFDRVAEPQILTVPCKSSLEHDVEGCRHSELAEETCIVAPPENDPSSPRCSERLSPDCLDKDNSEQEKDSAYLEMHIDRNAAEKEDIAKIADIVVTNSSHNVLLSPEKIDKTVTSNSCAMPDTDPTSSETSVGKKKESECTAAQLSGECIAFVPSGISFDDHNGDGALNKEENKRHLMECNHSMQPSREETNVTKNVVEEKVVNGCNDLNACSSGDFVLTERHMASYALPEAHDQIESIIEEDVKAENKELSDSTMGPNAHPQLMDIPENDPLNYSQRSNVNKVDDVALIGGHVKESDIQEFTSESLNRVVTSGDIIVNPTIALWQPPAEKALIIGPAQPYLKENDASLRLDQLRSELKKIVEGKARWKWSDRCEALKFLSHMVRNELNPDVFQVLNDSLSTLALNLKSHLEELRPSVITSSLSLFDSIISSELPSEKFTELLFLSVVEIASGYSMTAKDAAYSLANSIAIHPFTEDMLDSVENLTRLLEVAKEHADRSENDEQTSRRAQRALEILTRKSAAASFVPSPDTASISAYVDSQTPVASVDQGLGSVFSSSSETPRTFLADPTRIKKIEKFSAQPPQGVRSEKKLPSEDASFLATPRSEVPSSVDRHRSLRMSWRSRLEAPLSFGKKGVLKDAFIFGNADSSREKGSASNLRDSYSGRMYTSAEVEEIRQEAIEAVIDKMSQSHKEEKDKSNQDRMDLERMFAKEQAENKELRTVLEEYEITLNKMVAEGNTQANEKHLALQDEKNKLKAEVVEIRDAFEQLKRKYEKSKQTIDIMTTKEARIIEQNVELKRNMVELQKWSNELKANTEKKLNKAFENVTSFRTSYIEQEAHAKKALSDLEKIQSQLERETSNHADTAAKLAHCETELHHEQDASAELKAEFTSMKESFTQLSSERNTALEKLEEAYKQLGSLKVQVEKLESRANRASDLQKQMEAMRAERQELKARAFDDMTRIRQLEEEVEGKEKELDELGVICDEAMNQLEAFKLGRGNS